MKINLAAARVVVACALSMLAMHARSELVLVTCNNYVDLYYVDDLDNWTKLRTICAHATHGSFGNSYSAVFHNGVVYVATAKTESAATSKVIMVDLNGTLLGNLGDIPLRCDNLAVSPDGAYLFTGHGSGNGGQEGFGCVYRYSFAGDKWEKFANPGQTCIRNLAFDNDGNIYVTARKNWLYKYDWRADVSESPASGTTVSGYGLDYVCGLFFNQSNGYMYWSGQGGSFGRFKPDGSDYQAWGRSGYYSGVSYSFALVNGKEHIVIFNTVNISRRTDTDSDTPTFANLAFGAKVFDVSPVDLGDKKWSFDGTVDSPSLAGPAGNPVYLMGGACGGADGVTGTALCFTGATSRAEIGNSKRLFSDGIATATNDFAVAFWVGLPAAEEATGGRYLLSNSFGQDGEFSIMADPDAGHLNKLGLSFTPDQSGEPVTLATEGVVADGRWHHVAFVRRGGTTFELWLDGDMTGTVSVASTDAVARNWNWHLGSSGDETCGFIGAGAFIDELQVFPATSIPIPELVSVLAGEHAPGALPTIPQPAVAAEADPMPAAYGTEVAHALAKDAPVGDPSLLVAADGSYWIAAGRANGQAAIDAETTFWRSSDSGATWTKTGTLAASGVSLFESGGTVCAMGMKVQTGTRLDGLRTCAVWSYGDGVWTERDSYTHTAAFIMGPGSAAVANGRVGKPVAFPFAPYTTEPSFGYVSFAVDGTSFSAPHMEATLPAESVSGAFPTIAGISPGSAVAMADGTVAMCCPMADGKRQDVISVCGIERMWLEKITHGAAESTKGSYAECMFRGGAKPFDVKYDAQSGLYWALATSVTNSADIASRPADTIRNTLALYASPDLEEWRPCGVVDVSGDVDATGFNGPSFAIAGDDLVVAMGISCADGLGGARSTGHNTYLAFRRIPDFRTSFVPAAPGGIRMLTCNYRLGRIDSSWCDGNGEWYAAAPFASGFRYQQIASGNKRVYASLENQNPTTIKEYSNTGRVLRTLRAPAELAASGTTVAVALSPDLRWLYVTAESQPNKVFRVDLTTEAWDAFIDDSSRIKNPNRLAVGSDGSIYVANYKAIGGVFLINRYNAEGEWVETVYSGPTKDFRNRELTVSGLVVDDANRNLYFAVVKGPVYRVDLDTKEITTICDSYYSGVAFSYGLAIHAGKLHVTSTWGWVRAFDLETFEQTVPVSSKRTSYGITFADAEWRCGLAIRLR